MNEKQSRLDVLKKKKEQLSVRIQKIEALQKSRERKCDTRRKILIGAYFIDKANEEGSLDTLFKQLDGGYLTSVSLSRYKFRDIQVSRIHSPTRQVCLRRPGRPGPP